VSNRSSPEPAHELALRRHLLFTMLTACAWRDSPAGPTPVVAGLRAFLGGWLGIGRIVVGMARQSYDLQLTRYSYEGWRATFYPTGRGTSGTSAGKADETSHSRNRCRKATKWVGTTTNRATRSA
jgi:hypothetical protein